MRTSKNSNRSSVPSSDRLHKRLDGYETYFDNTLAMIDKNNKKQRNQYSDIVARDLKKLKSDGYVILEDMLSKDTINTMKTVSNSYLSQIPLGRNRFEGW